MTYIHKIEIMKQDFGKEMRFSTIEGHFIFLNNSATINKNKWEELESLIEIIIDEPSKNAIDIIYLIGAAESTKGRDYTFNKGDNPNISNPAFEQHIQFLSNTLMRCFSFGQQQGLFRQDLHKEMIGRTFARKYMDLYDYHVFTQDLYSFITNCITEFENFIKGLCNAKGLEYFSYFYSNKLNSLN